MKKKSGNRNAAMSAAKVLNKSKCYWSHGKHSPRQAIIDNLTLSREANRLLKERIRIDEAVEAARKLRRGNKP